MHGQERPVADSVVSYRQGTQRAASRITPGCELQLTAALRVVVRSRRADFVKDDSCGGLTHGTVWQQVRNCLSLVFEFVVKTDRLPRQARDRHPDDMKGEKQEPMHAAHSTQECATP
jgi:hypothetical protein